MVIAFIHADGSFLPEIKAYERFFIDRKIKVITAPFPDTENIVADVYWFIMGLSPKKRKEAVTIHEYSSASAPPFTTIKNVTKRMLNSRPDYRLFLNPYVKEKLAFADAVPFGFRDMGIDPTVFFPSPEVQKVYDFIYVGNLHYTRRIETLLECFRSGRLADHSLLVVSQHYDHYAKKFAGSSNIYFKGPMAATEVARHINSASFAINYIPALEPYTEQTSTKVIEYAGCRVPIISTSYPWIHAFRQQYGGQYFFLEPDLSNFNWESVTGFDFAYPDLSDWEWEKQIRRSGVLEFLSKKFPELGKQMAL